MKSKLSLPTLLTILLMSCLATTIVLAPREHEIPFDVQINPAEFESFGPYSALQIEVFIDFLYPPVIDYVFVEIFVDGSREFYDYVDEGDSTGVINIPSGKYATVYIENDHLVTIDVEGVILLCVTR